MLTAINCRPIIARFLLVLYIGMLANGILFLHAHRLADGTIITHAHPFKAVNNGPVQPNNHTQQELLWLDAVSNLLYTNLDLLVWSVTLAISFLPIPQQLFFTEFTWCNVHTAYQHRGPPSKFLLF